MRTMAELTMAAGRVSRSPDWNIAAPTLWQAKLFSSGGKIKPGYLGEGRFSGVRYSADCSCGFVRRAARAACERSQSAPHPAVGVQAASARLNWTRFRPSRFAV